MPCGTCDSLLHIWQISGKSLRHRRKEPHTGIDNVRWRRLHPHATLENIPYTIAQHSRLRTNLRRHTWCSIWSRSISMDNPRRYIHGSHARLHCRSNITEEQRTEPPRNNREISRLCSCRSRQHSLPQTYPSPHSKQAKSSPALRGNFLQHSW